MLDMQAEIEPGWMAKPSLSVRVRRLLGGVFAKPGAFGCISPEGFYHECPAD